MKAVILAGGLGTRLSEETANRPKPMIELGGQPILWHIMKTYYHQGVSEFLILAGYKASNIIEYFTNYSLYAAESVTFEPGLRAVKGAKLNIEHEKWTVTVLNTGLNTQTGGRLLRAKELLRDEEDFFLTYGDGLSNLNVWSAQDVRRNNNSIGTISAVLPQARYGALSLVDLSANSSPVVEFLEKPRFGDGYVNGGFMCLSPDIFQFLQDDKSNLEAHVLPNLADSGKLTAVIHNDFWKSMDTLRDKLSLEELWQSGVAPWKIW